MRTRSCSKTEHPPRGDRREPRHTCRASSRGATSVLRRDSKVQRGRLLRLLRANPPPGTAGAIDPAGGATPPRVELGGSVRIVSDSTIPGTNRLWVPSCGSRPSSTMKGSWPEASSYAGCRSSGQVAGRSRKRDQNPTKAPETAWTEASSPDRQRWGLMSVADSEGVSRSRHLMRGCSRRRQGGIARLEAEA